MFERLLRLSEPHLLCRGCLNPLGGSAEAGLCAAGEGAELLPEVGAGRQDMADTAGAGERAAAGADIGGDDLAAGEGEELGGEVAHGAETLDDDPVAELRLRDAHGGVNSAGLSRSTAAGATT